MLNSYWQLIKNEGRFYLDGYHQLDEQSAKPTAVANTAQLYAKDKAGTTALYWQDDAGLEHDLSAVMGGSGTAGQVAYFSSATALTSEAAFAYDATTNTLTILLGKIALTQANDTEILNLTATNQILSIKETTGQSAASMTLGTNGLTNGYLLTPESLILVIDSANDSSNRSFAVGHNGTPGSVTNILVLSEDGTFTLTATNQIVKFAEPGNSAATMTLGTAGQTNGYIVAPESLILIIDSNNDQSNRGLSIRKDAVDATGGSLLFSVEEDGSGRIGIGASSPGANGVFNVHVGLRVAGAAGAGTFLRGDGTNFVVSTPTLPNSATANRILYATGTNVWGESANLAYDGTDFLLGSGTRARMTGANRFRFLNTLAAAGLTADQTISNSTITIQNFDTEAHGNNFDTDTIHDTVTANSKFTPKIAGKYFLFAGFRYAATTAGSYHVGWRLNGSSGSDTNIVAVGGGGAGSFILANGFTVVSLAANDFIEFWAFQNTGGNVTLTSADTVAGIMYVGE